MAFGLSALVGIASAVIPKGMEYFERKQDNKQELAILDKQYSAQKDIAETRFDMSRMEGAEASYQASLEHDTKSSQYGAHTYLGRFLMDMINAWRASMRPGIVSTFMGLYVMLKVATIYTLCSGDLGAAVLAKAIIGSWGANDSAMLELGVSYYLTNRGVEKLSGKK